MTKGQKIALRVIRIAAKQLRDQVLSSSWAADAKEARADFHLGCDRFDCAMMNGEPARMSMKFYQNAWTQ